MFLYFCEELSRQYKERGISEEVFYESIKYLPDTLLKGDFKVGFTDREEIRKIEPKSEFARKIKQKALFGGKFYNVLGYLER